MLPLWSQFCSLPGIQLVAMGVIGEYVGRIFVESKGRPLYLLHSYLGAGGIHTALPKHETVTKAAN
jgi:hypothetical protein